MFRRENDSFFSILSQIVLKKNKNINISTQDTIPYKKMFRDGLCQVTDTKFNKMIEYTDINYQLAHPEDKNIIFGQYCSFLNSFDSSVSIQLTFVNELSSIEEERDRINISYANDKFNEVRKEYLDMLRNQLEKGNNGLVRRKYITVTTSAKTVREAKMKLSRIESEIINNFKMMGVSSVPLDGRDRLRLLHNLLNTKDSKFSMDWNDVKEKNLSTKDCIAPPFFDFREKTYFRMGKKYGQVHHLMVLAPELSDRTLADILDIESELIVNFHIQPIDQQEAIKMVKGKISDVDRMKIEEQKKAVRSGYDMDVIPTDLNTYAEGGRQILEALQSQNEKWFMVSIYLTPLAPSLSELISSSITAQSIAQRHNCDLKVYDYEQEEGLVASLPLGLNRLYPKRGLVTTATAVFVPFTTQELFTDGTPLYYGLNAISSNMIMVDRKQLRNPNGLMLGTPGSGKSFSAKREITNAFLSTEDDIMINDPEGEYRPLVETLHGQVINISQTSKDFVNPLDINMDYSEDESPITLKADFIMSMMELITGGKEGLLPKEKSIIDRCVRIIYQDYLIDPKPKNIPILEDLWKALKDQKSNEADNLADALEIYVTGSLNIFNNRTNVNINNRLVCFDIKELGKNLKKLGMLIIQDQVWNRVSQNRDSGKSTWYYMDEFHLLLKEEQTASYSVEIWKRFRKWGGIPTGITQNVKDLLESKSIENIFDNSDFIYLLSQASGDRMILADKLNISPSQLSFVDNSNAGEGLIIYGGIILPFKDHFPKDTLLYKVMTTKPEDLVQQKEETYE